MSGRHNVIKVLPTRQTRTRPSALAHALDMYVLMELTVFLVSRPIMSNEPTAMRTWFSPIATREGSRAITPPLRYNSVGGVDRVAVASNGHVDAHHERRRVDLLPNQVRTACP